MRMRTIPLLFLFLGWTVLAKDALAFNSNVVLFDFRSPTDPVAYLTQEELKGGPLPSADRGACSLPPGDLDRLLRDRFHKARGLNRFLTRAQVNEVLDVYVLVEGTQPATSVSILTLREASRDTGASREVAPWPKLNRGSAPSSSGPYFLHASFPLQFTRSSVTLGVSVAGRMATLLILTGPQEDVYLSANLPLDYFGRDFQRLPIGDQPHEFYLGLDYIPFGDLYLQDLQPVVHLFARASGDPFGSIGIGTGVRLPNFWGVMDLSNVTLTFNLVRVQDKGVEDYDWVCQAGYNLFGLFPGLFP